MKITTRIQVSIILRIVLTVTIGLFVFMAIQEMNDESREARIAAETVEKGSVRQIMLQGDLDMKTTKIFMMLCAVAILVATNIYGQEISTIIR